MKHMNFNCFYRDMDSWYLFFESTDIMDKILTWCENEGINLWNKILYSNVELFNYYIQQRQAEDYMKGKGFLRAGDIYEALSSFRIINTDTF